MRTASQCKPRRRKNPVGGVRFSQTQRDPLQGLQDQTSAGPPRIRARYLRERHRSHIAECAYNIQFVHLAHLLATIEHRLHQQNRHCCRLGPTILRGADQRSPAGSVHARLGAPEMRGFVHSKDFGQ